MGRASRRKRERDLVLRQHQAGQHDEAMGWLNQSRPGAMRCLACGRVRPDVGSPGFTPDVVAVVVEEWPTGDRSMMDAVHVECIGSVPGRSIQWHGFSGRLIRAC